MKTNKKLVTLFSVLILPVLTTPLDAHKQTERMPYLVQAKSSASYLKNKFDTVIKKPILDPYIFRIKTAPVSTAAFYGLFASAGTYYGGKFIISRIRSGSIFATITDSIYKMMLKTAALEYGTPIFNKFFSANQKGGNVYEPLSQEKFENFKKQATKQQKKILDTKFEDLDNMILYGPPGTGKSTIPQALAAKNPHIKLIRYPVEAFETLSLWQDGYLSVSKAFPMIKNYIDLALQEAGAHCALDKDNRVIFVIEEADSIKISKKTKEFEGKVALIEELYKKQKEIDSKNFSPKDALEGLIFLAGIIEQRLSESDSLSDSLREIELEKTLKDLTDARKTLDAELKTLTILESNKDTIRKIKNLLNKKNYRADTEALKLFKKINEDFTIESRKTKGWSREQKFALFLKNFSDFALIKAIDEIFSTLKRRFTAHFESPEELFTNQCKNHLLALQSSQKLNIIEIALLIDYSSNLDLFHITNQINSYLQYSVNIVLTDLHKIVQNRLEDLKNSKGFLSTQEAINVAQKYIVSHHLWKDVYTNSTPQSLKRLFETGTKQIPFIIDNVKQIKHKVTNWLYGLKDPEEDSDQSCLIEDVEITVHEALSSISAGIDCLLTVLAKSTLFSLTQNKGAAKTTERFASLDKRINELPIPGVRMLRGICKMGEPLLHMTPPMDILRFLPLQLIALNSFLFSEPPSVSQRELLGKIRIIATTNGLGYLDTTFLNSAEYGGNFVSVKIDHPSADDIYKSIKDSFTPRQENTDSKEETEKKIKSFAKKLSDLNCDFREIQRAKKIALQSWPFTTGLEEAIRLIIEMRTKKYLWIANQNK